MLNDFDKDWYCSSEHDELLRIAEDINEHPVDRIESICKVAINSNTVLEKEHWLMYIQELCKDL